MTTAKASAMNIPFCPPNARPMAISSSVSAVRRNAVLKVFPIDSLTYIDWMSPARARCMCPISGEFRRREDTPVLLLSIRISNLASQTPGLRFAHGHGAYRTLGEILAFNSEGVIEAGPVVFPCDGRCQFHQLRLGEPFPQTREQRIRNVHRSSGHRVRVLEHQPLQLREVEICSITIQVCDLFGRDPALSADGRADVNSKRATDERCDSQLGEPFELGVHQLAAHLRLLHLQISPEDLAVMSSDLHRHDDAAEPATGQPIDQAYEQATDRTALIAGRTIDACHTRSLPYRIHFGLGGFISSWSFWRSWARCSVVSSRFNSSSARAMM